MQVLVSMTGRTLPTTTRARSASRSRTFSLRESIERADRKPRLTPMRSCCRFCCRLTPTLSVIPKVQLRQITLSVNDLQISCRTSYSLAVA
jgi:hypothetical protein